MSLNRSPTTDRTSYQFRAHDYPTRNEFQSPIQKQRSTLLLACLTAGFMAFTIYFAYNSSLEQPMSPRLIFSRPERSILVLNIASQLTIFCLAELTSCVFEAVRWAIACSAAGSNAFTFLSLSRATNALGVLCLLFGSSGDQKFGKDGHRLWGGQRIFFAVVRAVLGILLLSDISFRSTYRGVTTFPIHAAGVAPLNTSVINTQFFNDTATAEFWWYFPALLTDSKRVRAATPLNCTTTDCISYFMPGSLSSVQLDPSLPPITESQYPKAISYITNNAPGYQIDFQQIDRVKDPNLMMSDCRLYGWQATAVQICLKTYGHSILAAWSSCPNDVRGQNSCFNTTDWRVVVPFNTKMTVSQRRASAVFDRFNFTITDVIDISDPISTNYTAEDFFTFFDIVFALNETDANWWKTTQYLFLLGIQTYLGDPTSVQNGTGSDDRLSRLQEFMATPIFLFNNFVYGGPLEDMGKSATLAIPSYRLIIAPYTLYSFFIGGFISLLWCFIALGTSMLIQTPNTSLFPEIDIASKLSTEKGYEATPFLEPRSLAQLLWPLSNAGSLEIRRRLVGQRFFVRFSDNNELQEESKRVVIMLQENGLSLNGNGEKPVTEVDHEENTAYRTEPMNEELRTVPYAALPPEMSSRYM